MKGGNPMSLIWQRVLICVVLAIVGWWYWSATTPAKAVGRLETKLGPGWCEVVKIPVFGHSLRLSYWTYTLCLIDGHGQRCEVDVSPADFEAAKFDETDAWDVSRIRRHYCIEWD